MTENELILTHILNCSRSDLYLCKPQLTARQQKQLENCKRRRRKGEPLQYILGVCDFMGFELKVDHRVLIPRPETEVLVDEAIQRIKNLSSPKILDLGTGSGNIAITLAKLVPGALITTADISKDALDLAKENAKRHSVEGRIKFIQADMLVSLRAPASCCRKTAAGGNDTRIFDLIISNPPYIPTAQMKALPADVQQEPRAALEAGKDGLKFYREIIKHTPPLLRSGGYLMMEFGDACLPAGRDRISQASEIQSMIEHTRSFSRVEIIKDLTGKDRIICARKF